MQSVTLTRKERIMKERAIMAKGRRRKVVGFALVGSIATTVLVHTNGVKALACSDTYVVQKGDNLYTLAKKYDVSVEQLQQANELSSDFIKVGQTLEVPLLEEAHSEHEESRATKTAVPLKQVKVNTTKKETKRLHTVVRGDSLSLLAKKYDVSVEQLQQANELSSDFIEVGQTLEVPLLEEAHSEHEELRATKMAVPPKQVKVNTTKKETKRLHTVVRGDSLSLLAKKYGVSIEQLQKVNGLTSDMIKVDQKLDIPSEKVYAAKKMMINNREKSITYATYTVAPGETIWSIARQFNMSIDQLKAYNHMSSNAVLIGQKLIIKQKNLIKVDAIVGGAVDQFSVEFMINGEPSVLQVAYGTASNFERLSGKKVELAFYKANRPTLVSSSLAE